MIFYIGFSAILLYVAYSLLMQLIKSRIRNNRIKLAAIEYEASKQKCSIAKQNLMKSIVVAYGPEKAQKIEQGIIWVGMHKQLLLIAKGKANHIKKTISNGATTEICYYGKYLNIFGDDSYTNEVTLENDILIHYKDFDKILV